MRITLPQSDVYPKVRLTITTPVSEQTYTADDSHRVANIELPEGVGPEDVLIVAEFCDTSDKPVALCRGMILHEPTLRPAVEPPAVEPPAVEPPAVEPPAVEPPAVEPSTIEPPVLEDSEAAPPARGKKK